jgi:hypothetical protein
MLAFLNQVRKPTLDLPLEVRRKMWFKPFMQSYLVVFIGYLTMYLIRKNFNIAQNDMISTYGLSMTQLGMIGLGFSITYGVVRNGQVQSHLPLPIAGLMSTDTAQSLAEQIDALKAAARECGPLPDEPFIQMAFLSLPVIPALKLTSQGLFDGEKFAFTTLEVTE